jgi:transcription antitermination factor NusG
MWIVAATAAKTELLARDRLRAEGLTILCPYTREKVREKVRTPVTRANPSPRTVFKASWQDVARWPRYIFARVRTYADVAAVEADDDVRYILRCEEARPALLTDATMAEIQRGCDADGKVINRKTIVDFSVGDMLRFVAGSSFAGQIGQVTGINDNGTVHVIVDGLLKARVDFKELTSAIG